ncbi:MAG: hypothetical protein KBD05_00460 [Candidatus Pacebacteria bacterium]|nr:hypothetical protein [Candidatus Paceibacterota bacterium]
MLYLAFFIASLVLFVGFLGVTAVEGKRGTRFFAPARATFDAKVSRVAVALQHVDFSAFLWHLTKDVSGRVVHDVAHISLIIVRYLERLLTRLVRYMRGKVKTSVVPVEGKRSAFVETMSYFKKTLHRSRQTPVETKEEV